MQYRQLGGSGLNVPVLCFGTATFGGDGYFGKWGQTPLDEARRMVDICLDVGVNFFDTADVYTTGASEAMLGQSIVGKRDKLIISTKSTFRMSDEPNDAGSSRHHIIRSVENSLRRLQTDYIDIYTMHGFDAKTPVEETLRTLDMLVQSGKIRYLACSNFSGWHLMKSLGVSDRYGWSRYVGHQAHYSLISREYEWELMPLALDQKVGTLVWSPLNGGRLGGRIRRSQPIPEGSRIKQGGGEGPHIPDEWFYALIDVVDAVAAETGKSVAQVALNWLLQRPTISTIVIGARTEEQLQQNLGAVGWSLTAAQMEKLDRASQREMTYPYWHQQAAFYERNPSPTKRYD